MFFISIAPKIDANNYGPFVDVTNYVDAESLSDIDIDTFTSDFGSGIADTGSIDLSLLNIDGRFSDEFSSTSMFKYSRNESQVKIEWFGRSKVAILGQAMCGIDILGDSRITVFSGIIDEISPREDIRTKYIDMTIVGKDSIFDKTEIDTDDISILKSTTEIMADLLNKQKIKNILSISQTSEWDLGIDFTYIDLENFEDVTTVKDALTIILEHTNSVLSIIDDVVYVSSRVETDDLKYTFNAPHVEGAIDNIIDIQNISTGINRTFNKWRFSDDPQSFGSFGPESLSIEKYGIRAASISTASVDLLTKENILQTYYNFYEFPKQEFDLVTPLNIGSVMLKQFDKVKVNYPIKIIYQGKPLPRWGQLTSNTTFTYPITDNSFYLQKESYFKIIKLSYNLLKETLTIKLRGI